MRNQKQKQKKRKKGGGGTCNVEPGATKWAQRGQPPKKKTQNYNTNKY